jgi:hypothetical protein
VCVAGLVPNKTENETRLHIQMLNVYELSTVAVILKKQVTFSFETMFYDNYNYAFRM